MDARFIRAFTSPGETTLLGHRMKPFSLKHRMALHAIESPFVTPGKEVSVLDLFVAVKICSEKSIRRLSFMDVIRMSYIKAKPSRIESYIMAFHEYSNVVNWPKFWDKEKRQGGSNGIPWILSVASNLISKGWSEEDAWSLPESQAVWYHTAISINNGNDVAIMSEQDEHIMKNFESIAKDAKAKPRVRRPQKTNK
jgi:hypothetical protein